MNTVELFCGTKSFSKVAKKLGYKTFTHDINKKYDPDLCKDIFDCKIEDFPKNIDILWASPPCTEYSVMNQSSRNLPYADSIIEKMISLIIELKPKFFFIENPASGLMKTRYFIRKYPTIFGHFQDVTYCMYGFPIHKYTRIWTNFHEWVARSICVSGKNLCGFAFEKDFYAGHIGKDEFNNLDKDERIKIPPALFFEIFETMWSLK